MFDFRKEPGKNSPGEKRCFENSVFPLISVITPFYNAGEYINQTYTSMINQTFPWYEWIIVDDGSTETEQVELLKELCDSDARIILIQKENGGISSARNAGIRRASADILVMLDADDLIVPTYLEVLYWMMYKNTCCDWAYTNTVGFQDQEYLWDQPFDSERLKTYNFLTYSAAIRKPALLEVGGYDDSEKHYYEDWHLWLRMLAAGKRPVKSSLYGFWYRRQDSGVLGKINTNEVLKKKALLMIRQAADRLKTPVYAKAFPRTPEANRFEKFSKYCGRLSLPLKEGVHTILFLIPWMRMGGSEVFELEILKNIDKSLFEIVVATTVDAPLEWRQRFEAYTDDVFELPSFLDMEDYPEFISYLIQTRHVQTVFVTNSYYGYCLMPWLRMEFPDLVLMDYVHMEEWYWRRGGYARISASMREMTEHTFVCNERTRSVMLDKFARKSKEVSTLYIGTDPDRYDPDAVAPGRCYDALGIPEDRAIILFPCRMDAQKRPFLMLEIAKECRRRELPVAFAAVGEGGLLDSMKAFCRENRMEDVVYFTGQAEDVRPYYKDAFITLNCSIREGLALTTFESFSMGVPVISADVGGQKELIDDKTGIVLPIYQNERDDFGNTDYSAEEIAQYVDAIRRLLNAPVQYSRMCKECRKRILERFSTRYMTKQLEQAFLYYRNDTGAAADRREKSEALKMFPFAVEEFMVLYHEIESRDAMYRAGVVPENKEELLRIAESKWGQRFIKLFFRLGLNRLCR